MARTVAEATRPGPSGPVTARIVAREPRDQLGHWVAPPSMKGHPCPHRCCRNRQAHPDKLPVRLDRDYLKSLPADKLEEELVRYHKYIDEPRGERNFKQVAAEVDRREAAERAKDRRRQREQDYHDEVYREWLAAENGIQGGVLLNKRGIAAGINERSLFTGAQARVDRYASDELKEWFESHPRPTRARILGKGSARRAQLSRAALRDSLYAGRASPVMMCGVAQPRAT